jgi:hypothetical protein
VKNIFIKEVVNYMPAFSDPELVRDFRWYYLLWTDLFPGDEGRQYPSEYWQSSFVLLTTGR